MSSAIPGPGRWTTLQRLLPVPFRRFPDFLAEMTERYGDVLAFSLPWRSYVFVNDPALVKDILVTQQHAFSKSLGTRVLRLLLGDGLLTSEEPLHRQMRRIVQPAFHRERIAEYARVMERDAADFVERIRPNEVFDAHGAMTELTLRIATETLFGSDESESARLVREALRLMMNEFPKMLTPAGALVTRLPFPSTRRFWRARAMLDELVYGLIARRRLDPSERGDALSMLLAAGDRETEDRPSDEQIRDEIMTLFMAGHETTANTLTWSLFLLAQNDEVDRRAALAACDGDREYLTQVVKEVLRLYPPAWIIGREALRDVTLSDGSCIPATTTVFMVPLLLHRKPQYFTNPDAFEPDRWLESEPPPFAYIPFGGGARRCIGDEFALRETTIVLETLLRSYRFTLEPGARVETAPLVTLRPAGPVPMRAIARVRNPS
ncbi:MAG TPA: cytochrome P450 [Candidatus Cybelea sp.]|nr:cytochrome P450 [Candidatus Cybelea sp.]